MDELIKAFIMLLAVIEPPGIVPVFLGLTMGADKKYRQKMALKSSVIALVLLLMFAFVGDYILDVLGISQAAFRVGGGLLLLLMAIDMVFAKHSGVTTATADEQEEALHRPDISVFPVAIPLIAGPGGLTTVIILMRKVEGSLMMELGMGAVIVAVMGLTYLTLRLAEPIGKLLGVTGANVLGRVFGIILAGLAMQLMISGLLQSFPILAQTS